MINISTFKAPIPLIEVPMFKSAIREHSESDQPLMKATLTLLEHTTYFETQWYISQTSTKHSREIQAE